MTIYHPSFSRPFSTRRESHLSSGVRSDSAIEEEIWTRLSKENSGVFSPDHIAVEVRQGQVYLWGHVAEEWQRQTAKTLAALVRGVIDVWNELVQDQDLYARVLRALSKDVRTAAYLIPVKCSFGWVSLGGMVPTRETAEWVESVAASIAGVRGITGIPWVAGLPWTQSGQAEFVRRTFQPRMGAAVHDGLSDIDAGSPGIVSRVILDPTSRLLTHVAVQVRETEGDRSYTRERVIPVSTIEAANRDNVWLKAGEAIRHCPLFQAYRYPGVPQDWRPPFPYKAEMVRWSGRQAT